MKVAAFSYNFYVDFIIFKDYLCQDYLPFSKINTHFLIISTQGDKVYYLQRNPGQLLNMLGKLFVFSFTWSMGGMFKRQEDGDDDDMIRRGQDKGERDTNICNEFDNFMHELFEVEPPLGNFLPVQFFEVDLFILF